MKKHLKIFTLVLYVAVFVGCKKEKTGNPPGSGDDLFVSATASGSYSKTQLQLAATLAGYANFISFIQYDVDFYKIVYRTNYKGNMIPVSGLLALPKNPPVAPSLLSAQHGTMFKLADAPSNFPNAFTGFELFASGGFATIIPDFIGYGSSANIKHPYYDQQLSGTVVVDMIKAVKFYLDSVKVPISNRLFLIGYSEGGYVTMAAQKEIETNASHNLALTAAAAGAGGYDLTGMLSQIASTPTYGDPSYLAFILQSYNTTYNWNRPYTDFFKEPYASRIPALLDGTKSQGEVNAGLTSNTADLFNPTFYSNLTVPTAETTLKQALVNNSFLTWVPRSPTKLYHGTADQAVFFQTSQSTIDRFKAAGATNVELVRIENGDHGSSIQPMMLDVIPWIRSLDK